MSEMLTRVIETPVWAHLSYVLVIMILTLKAGDR